MIRTLSKTAAKRVSKLLGAFLTLLSLPALVAAQNASPLGGVGSLQFFDNNGNVLTNGVVYIYQAGTSTQVAVYVDATGTTQQPNPVTFGSGARSSIWLANGTFVKIVLCIQNDGPAACAAGDILFSADQVPIGSTGGGGGGGGGSPFTGIFISSTASPATSGILRLATSDSVCFRNAAGSANLCISKDANDLLSWAGGSLKLPEVGAPGCVAGFDIFWADNSVHRFKMCGNGGTAAQVVASGVDINTSDQVTQLHFGATGTPLSSTPPTTNQLLGWNGTNIVGVGTGFPIIVYNTASASTNANILATTMITVGASSATYRFSFYVAETVLGSACTGNTTIVVEPLWTDPFAASQFAPSSAASINLAVAGNGVLGPAASYNGNNIIAANGTVFRAKNGTAIQYLVNYFAGSGCSPGPQFQLFPILEQLTAN